MSGMGSGGATSGAAVLRSVAGEMSDEAAIRAADQSVKADDEIRRAMCRELKEARYESSLASRRYEAVDPTKRLAARELD